MCGWTLISNPATSAARSSIRANPAVENEAPRSLTKTNGLVGSSRRFASLLPEPDPVATLLKLRALADRIISALTDSITRMTFHAPSNELMPTCPEGLARLGHYDLNARAG